MKLIVASLLSIMIVAVVMQVVSSTAFDFNGHSQASDPDAKSMETKMAETLHNIALASSINSSAINLSVNATSNNSTMLNSSTKLNGSGGGAIADGTTVSSQELGANSKGAIKGFWGIQASKHVMGQSDINSQMFLSGTFDVDKAVKFSG
ncbi:MAG: hypothetical protein WB392_02730 [Methanotrichaceae archaeon]